MRFDWKRLRRTGVAALLILALSPCSGFAAHRLSDNTARCAAEAYRSYGEHWFGGNASHPATGQLFVGHGLEPGQVDVWKGCGERDRTVLTTRLASSTYVRPSSSARYLLASQNNGPSELFDLKSRASLALFPDCIGPGVFTPDERFVFLSCFKGVQAYDLFERRLLSGLYNPGPGYAVNSMAVNAKATQIAFGLEDGRIELATIDSDGANPRLCRQAMLGVAAKNWASAVNYSIALPQLLTVLRDGRVQLWDLESGALLHAWQTPLTWVGSVTIIGDNAQALIYGMGPSRTGHAANGSVLIDPVTGRQHVAATPNNYLYASLVSRLNAVFVGGYRVRPMIVPLESGQVVQAKSLLPLDGGGPSQERHPEPQAGQATESGASPAPAVCQAIAQIANSGGLLSSLTLPDHPTPDGSIDVTDDEAVQLRLDFDGDGRIDTVYAGNERLSIRGPANEDLAVTRDPDVDWDRERFRGPGLLGAFKYGGKQYLVWGATHAPAFASTISGKRVEQVTCEFVQKDSADRVPVNIALSEYERFLDAAKERASEPWSFAMQRKDTAGLELLVRNGRSVNDILGPPERGDTTPLLLAIGTQQLSHVDWLLSQGADPNLSAGYVGSPLREAIRQGDHSIVKRLLDAGADPKVPYYELAGSPGDNSGARQEIVIEVIKRLGYIPDIIARSNVRKNPELADRLLRLELPVALDGIEWESGESRDTPSDLSRSLQAQPELLRTVDQLFARTIRTPGYGATAQYLNGDRGWVVQRLQNSALSDHDFLMMSTNLCVYFFDAACGPHSLLSEAQVWEKANPQPCPDPNLAQEMGAAACSALAAYSARASNTPLSIFTITSIAKAENHLATLQEFRDLRRARTARAGDLP